MDEDQNLYIADTDNHAIRKVTPDGIITTIAGDGTSGFTGDGGFATSARLDSPSGIAVNSYGDIFIADTGNQRIRMIDHGTDDISTIAGTGTAGYNGDGSTPTTLRLNNPRGLAVSGTSVYIADQSNHRIRKLTATGDDTQTSTLAVVLTKDARLYLNGEETSEAALAQAVRTERSAKPDVQAIISADKEVSHGEVIRLIDLVKVNGVSKFAINIDPEVARAARGGRRFRATPARSRGLPRRGPPRRETLPGDGSLWRGGCRTTDCSRSGCCSPSAHMWRCSSACDRFPCRPTKQK